MKLFLQKNAKFSSAGGSAPRPPKQPPHCKFLATRLLSGITLLEVITDKKRYAPGREMCE